VAKIIPKKARGKETAAEKATTLKK
jgi:hypothetical protein